MINKKMTGQLCVGLVFAGIYNAAEASSWVCQSGNWSDTACWSSNILPSLDDGIDVDIAQSDAEMTIDAASGAATASFLRLDNEATVRQTGGTLNVYAELVGLSGNASYIQTGGSNSATRMTIASSAGSNGTYFLSGPATSLNVAGSLDVGLYGKGMLNIEAGGEVGSINGYIGVGNQYSLSSSTEGTVRVSGSGSRWTNQLWLMLGSRAPAGFNTRGSLNIDNGGEVSTAKTVLGDGAGAIGIATVSGSGSKLLNSESLVVGFNGDATVNVESGGLVSDVDGYIAMSTGNGTVNVAGNGSQWNNSGLLSVGHAGGGSLNVSSGGLVGNADGFIGREADGNGSATVAGAGSHWQNDGNLSVGYFGKGWLNIENGGEVSSNTARVGEWSGSRGTVAVSGPGAQWAVDQDLRVGESGDGSLRVESGGTVNASYGAIGFASGGNGSITVTGNGSQLNTSGALSIGDHGAGALNISAGGMVNTNGYAFLGAHSGSLGSATIGGAGSQWNNRGNLHVGGGDYGPGGQGEVTVTAGGMVNVAGALKVWDTGSVNMRGGTINANTMTSEGALNFTAGKLNIAADLVVDALGSAPGVALSELGAINVAGATILKGAGILALEGGTLTTGSLVNNGGFIFNKGTLNLTKDNLLVGNGGLLGGMVELKTGQNVNVTNTARIDSGSVLVLNNGSLNAGTVNNLGRIVMDGYLASLGGGTLNNSGLISGSGQIKASLHNAGGEIRANSGDMQVFTGAGNVNESRISLLGGSMDFNQGLTNKATGQITGHGTLVTGSTMATGLTNQGSLALNDDSEIIGDVNNTGRIVVSAGSTATFHDDMIHNGSEIKVSAGSQAIFFGDVSGAGRYTGTGTTFFEGGFNPGNSPALVSFGGNMSLGEFSLTTLELGGLQRGSEYDAFDVAGNLSLNGSLNIVAYDLGSGLFSPKLGDTFDLFTAETIAGGFDLITYAALGNGLGWHLDYLTDFVGTTDYVRLSVVSAVPLPAGVWLFGSGLAGLISIRRRMAPVRDRRKL